MRRVIAALVATIAGLVALLSFKTASSTPPSTSLSLSESTNSSDGDTPTTQPPITQPSAAPTATPTTTAAPKATVKTTPTTVTGGAFTVSEGRRTFGQVQVQVTLANGKITNLVAISYPNDDSRSSEISSYSIPLLTQEVLKAQGTKIDVVSGATYTTAAYAQSVQAALDSAKS